MSNPRKFTMPLSLFGGIGAYFLGKFLEKIGDAAPMGAERTLFHVAALAAILVGLACFLRAGFVIWRWFTGGTAPTEKAALTRVFADEPEPASDFDPDAALSRYMARKAADPQLAMPAVEQPVRPPATFGRKQV